MCIRSCLCWHDMKSPTVAAGTFALATSLVQILVTVAVFIAFATSGGLNNVDPPSLTTFNSVIAKLYIALSAADAVVVLFSFILLVEVERGGGWRFCMVPWLIWIPIYILYECAINIYFFYTVFTTSENKFYGYGMAFIVPLVYWAVKEIILFLGWLCVVSRMCSVDATTHQDYDSYGQSTMQLIQTPKVQAQVVQPARDFYYSGASHIPVHQDTRARPISHFDAVRPTSNPYQYGGYGGYGGRGGVAVGGGAYGTSRYIYGPN